MAGLLDRILSQLSSHWKVRRTPRSKRAYHCDCGRLAFFLAHECPNCGGALGYEPDIGDLRSLTAGTLAETWRPSGDDIEQDYRRCANLQTPAECNWLVPASEDHSLCLACRLNRELPDLEDADNQRYWRLVERRKRRLISQLIGLDLPIVSRQEDPKAGLAFDLLRSPANGPPVLTGHAGGVITINIEEADDAKREQIRAAFNEPYRTLLGHFRHEIGHYYWDRLIWNTHWLEPFRELFGDERADYSEALKGNYEGRLPPDWPQHFISRYASCHPWEDWAETWAHYLHIVDSLDTAVSHGLQVDVFELKVGQFTLENLYDPTHPDAERNLYLLNCWIEMIGVLNRLARSLGQPDFYPFEMPKAVVKKLHFISLVIG